MTYSAGKSSQPEWPHSWMRSWPEKEENTEHRQKQKCVLITLKCYWTWHPFLKQRPTLCAGSVKGGLSDDCSSSSSLSSSSRVSPLEKWMVLLCLDPAGPPNSVSWVSGDVWQITQVFTLTFSWAVYQLADTLLLYHYLIQHVHVSSAFLYTGCNRLHSAEWHDTSGS